MIQRTLPEDEIGYVILDKNFNNDIFLGQNDVSVSKIRAAKIFSDKAAADSHLYQLKQIQPYYADLYDNKKFTIKPVRVSIIYVEG